MNRPESARELQTKHIREFLDNEVNELESALEIKLQTNYSWSWDSYDHSGKSEWSQILILTV